MTAPTLILLLIIIITIMFTIIIIDLKTHIENEYALVQTQNDYKQVRALPLIEFHFMQIIRKLDMTQCRILGKFEYTRGPIFKVVLEC